MASTPPDGWSILPEGWTWSDVGHGALDIAGLVPIIGEGADLANAAWLAAEEDYLGAGLSIISMVPIVGDAIGKGGKLLDKAGGKLAGPALDALRKMDFQKMLAPLAKDPKIGPVVDKIVAALNKWRDDIAGKTPACTPGGKSLCPKVGNLPIVTKGWKGNPLDSEVGRDIVDKLKKEGLSEERAIAKAQEMMESGLGLPEKILVKPGDKLFKLSPTGASPTTPYWMTKSELDSLRGLSNAEIGAKLGLPPGSIPPNGTSFALQSIEAAEHSSVFRSVIAPLEQGGHISSGGGTQMLVPGRSSFSPPSLSRGFP